MEALGVLGFIFGSGAMFFGLVAWSQISVLRNEFGEIWKQINETPLDQIKENKMKHEKWSCPKCSHIQYDLDEMRVAVWDGEEVRLSKEVSAVSN